jgi:hypothetical protein
VKAVAADGSGLTVEMALIDMPSGSSGPILGPDVAGSWMIVRTSNGKILRWINANDPGKAALELARVFGVDIWKSVKERKR